MHCFGWNFGTIKEADPGSTDELYGRGFVRKGFYWAFYRERLQGGMLGVGLYLLMNLNNLSKGMAGAAYNPVLMRKLQSQQMTMQHFRITVQRVVCTDA